MRFGLKSLGELLIRITISMGAMTIAAPEMAFAAETVEHWEKTGLNDSHLKKFLSQEKCYADEISFLGCIDAINSILDSGYPEKVLTNKNIERMPEMGDVVINVEKLKIQLLKSSSENLSIMESTRIATAERKMIAQSWRTVYQFTKNKQLSIEKILNVSLGFTRSSFRAQKLANAINEYYRTAVDPHTYITPASQRKEKQSTSENVTLGIGIQLVKSQNNIYLTPKTGSSAFAAGLKPTDVLVQVDGTDITDFSVSDVAEKIAGEENTPVNITVLRNGKKRSYEILRTRFVEKNLAIQVLNDPINRSRIGYIKINNFAEMGVCQKFIKHAIALRNNNAKSLILDLRGNPGGLVSEGECIASAFLNEGNLIFTENDPATNRVKTPHYAKKSVSIYELYGRKPLVILADANSASASEIVAGSLRAYNKAVIVGERSFGKGTIQFEHKWEDSGLEDLKGITIMKTITRFHFSDGESNQLVGITPDIEAHSKPFPTEEDLFAIREADKYLNAVSAASYTPYQSTAKVRAINSCIANRRMVDAEYAYRMNSHLVPDRQMSIAREAASCL